MTALTNIQMNKPDFSIDSIMRKENMPRIRDPKAAAAPLVMPVPTVPAGRYYSPVYPRPLCEPAYFLPTAEAIQAAFPWYRPRFTGLHRFAAGPDFSGYLLPPFRKAKRIRTAFSASQLMKLESAFDKNHYVTGNERKQLAQNLGLTETQVKVWFQNRRTKEKRQVIDERGDKNQTIHVDKMESQNQRLSPTQDQSVSPIRRSSSPSLCVSDDVSFNGESGKEEEIA